VVVSISRSHPGAMRYRVRRIRFPPAGSAPIYQGVLALAGALQVPAAGDASPPGVHRLAVRSQHGQVVQSLPVD
jgi:hypothetical protein